MSFETVKSNYVKNLWTKTMVALCVKKGLITPIQYTEVTGDLYIA